MHLPHAPTTATVNLARTLPMAQTSTNDNGYGYGSEEKKADKRVWRGKSGEEAMRRNENENKLSCDKRHETIHLEL